MIVDAGANDSYASPSHLTASVLRHRGYGTLTVNLLTPAEEDAERTSGGLHLDVAFLAGRVCQTLGVIRCHPDCRNQPVGVLGEGMAAAGAIVSASHHGEVQAIVCWNGRADLAGDALKQTSAPTLLIVSRDQPHVADLNRKAAASLGSIKALEIMGVPSLETDAARVIGERTADWFDAFVAVEDADHRQPVCAT